VVSESGGSLSVGQLLNLECAYSAVATLEAEMKVARAVDPVVVWRVVDRCGRVRHPSFRSRCKVSRVVLYSGYDRGRCLGVSGGYSGQVQLRDRLVSVGGCARQSRKYPWPVRRPKTVEESLQGRVVYAASNRRWKGAAYIFGCRVSVEPRCPAGGVLLLDSAADPGKGNW
jgi:hypothetical protein